MGAENVKADDALVVSLVHDDFCVALIGRAVLSNRPLEGRQSGVCARQSRAIGVSEADAKASSNERDRLTVHFDVCIAELRHCILLAQAAAPVLERREHGRWDEVVLEAQSASTIETAREQPTGSDRDWRQLRVTLHDISNGEDVRNVRLLRNHANLATAPVDARIAVAFRVQASNERAATHSDSTFTPARSRPSLAVSATRPVAVSTVSKTSSRSSLVSAFLNRTDRRPSASFEMAVGTHWIQRAIEAELA